MDSSTNENQAFLRKLNERIAELEKHEAFQKKEAERNREIYSKHIANMPLDHIECQEYKGYEADMIRHYWVWRNVRTELDALKSLRASLVCEDIKRRELQGNNSVEERKVGDCICNSR